MASSRIDKASKAFAALEGHAGQLNACIDEWKGLEQHFASLETTLKQKLAELSERERAFLLKTDVTKAALDKREESIPTREQSSISRIHVQKDDAIAALRDEKPGEKKTVNSNKRKQEKQESDTPAKPLFDPQSQQDAQKRAKLLSVGEEKKSTNSGQDSKVKGSLEEAIRQVKAVSNAEISSQLETFWKKSDAEGFGNFCVSRRKEAIILQTALVSAFRSISDPGRFVLRVMEPLYDASLNSNRKSDIKPTAYVTACLRILECLVEVVVDPVLSVSSDVKELAKIMAKRWKSMLELKKDEDGHALYAHAFLQLIATYGIVSAYSDDELLKCFVVIARRDRAPTLCRSLGLTSKIPELIHRLASEGKRLEALFFAHSFGIMDKVQPRALIDSYLKDVHKAAESLADNSKNTIDMHLGALSKELGALKNVIKAVEKYNLGSVYPLSEVHRRMDEIRKQKKEVKAAFTKSKNDDANVLSPKKLQTNESKAFSFSNDKIGSDSRAGYNAPSFSIPYSSAPLGRSHLLPSEVGQYTGSMLSPSPYGLSSPSRRADPVYASGRSPHMAADSARYLPRDRVGYLPGSAPLYTISGDSYGNHGSYTGLTPSRSYLPSYFR